MKQKSIANKNISPYYSHLSVCIQSWAEEAAFDLLYLKRSLLFKMNTASVFIYGDNKMLLTTGKCWEEQKRYSFPHQQEQPGLGAAWTHVKAFCVSPMTFLKDTSSQKGVVMLFSWVAVYRVPLNGILCQT